MCCQNLFKDFYIWLIDLCNGSLYSFDEENNYKNFTYEEMKKKDLIDIKEIDIPYIININNKEKESDSEKDNEKEKEKDWDVME
jgi:hypothetical protein